MISDIELCLFVAFVVLRLDALRAIRSGFGLYWVCLVGFCWNYATGFGLYDDYLGA
jgi:hypothetical protein